MASVVSNRFKKQLANDAVSLSADSFYCALVTSAITLSSDTQIRKVISWSQLSAFEVSGSGYDANGKLLSSITVTEDANKTKAIWDAANLSWTNTSMSAVRGAVLYTSGYNDFLGFVDFGSNKSTSNANFNLNWSTNGILNIN